MTDTVGVPVEFVTRARARFAELDPYGHVNMEHYLSYFIDHRFEGLRETLGMDLRSIARLPVLFVVRNVKLDFIKSLRAEDLFEIRSRVTEFRDRTCDVMMDLMLVDGEACARCLMELTCVDRRTGSPVAWPSDLVAKFYTSPSP